MSHHTHINGDDLTADQVIWLTKRMRYSRYRTSWLMHRDRNKVLIIVQNKDGSYWLFAVKQDGKHYPGQGLHVMPCD